MTSPYCYAGAHVSEKKSYCATIWSTYVFLPATELTSFTEKFLFPWEVQIQKETYFFFFPTRSKHWLAGCSELAQQSQKYSTRVSMCAWHLRNSATGFCMTPPSQHKTSISETYKQTHLLHPLHMCRGLTQNSCSSAYCKFKHTTELMACTAAEKLCYRILLPSSSPIEDSSVTL